MTYRVIDSDDYKASGIDTLFFPGGEPHAKLPLFKERVLFLLKCRNMCDIMLGACVWDALVRAKQPDTTLFIPYFPGARQDRSNGEAPLTKNLMSRWFGGSRVFTFDLHSHNGMFNGNMIMPENLDIPVKSDVVGIIAPDAGAVDRATSFRNKFYPSVSVIECSKNRDPKTGTLFGYHCPDLLERGKYIIVDDICDGGGTFNLLAEAFFNAKKGPGSRLELFVSHGIFSKGLDALDGRIDYITTTDSWCRYPSEEIKKNWESAHSRLTVLRLFNLFDRIMGV